MPCYSYYNNEIKPTTDLRISLNDRALFFGDGVYEVLLARNGLVYQAKEHFERLAASCSATRIEFSFNTREMLSIIHKLLDLSKVETASIYIQVSRRCSKRQHDFEKLPSNLLIIVSKCPTIQMRSVTAITVRDIRSEMCNVKSLNLLPSVLALNEAQVHHSECAIFVRGDYVTEESRSNVAIILNGQLLTHPANNYILSGITRKNLILVCEKCGIPVVERPFTVQEMISAEEVFVSSTTKFIQRVNKIDGIAINNDNSTHYEELFGYMFSDFLNKTD